MITIHIDSKEDTAFLSAVYIGLKDNKTYINPTREEVESILKENPTERVLLMGHGSQAGLFSSDWRGYVIDRQNVHLLRGREVIGIWCWAKKFAESTELKGFFTSMFISNISEYKGFFPNTSFTNEQDIFDEITFFSKEINTLITNDIPMDTWVKHLNEVGHKEKDYVKFNYDALAYYDGREVPSDEDKANTSFYYFLKDVDSETLMSFTIEEILEYAYTEGYKAGQAEM